MRIVGLWAFLMLSACADGLWNNPYPSGDSTQAVLYSAFDERPKHLDPARSYSAEEAVFLGQIYDPPLQYHYLKRPFTLEPASLQSLPELHYENAAGERVERAEATHSVYTLSLRRSMRFQPHPALARSDDGNFRYHDLSEAQLRDLYELGDFKHSGSREITAEDFVYQIKRLAHPGVHSPILGLMSGYIEGLSELSQSLKSAHERDPEAWLDLREFELSGVQVLDRYRFQIRLKQPYPQFKYWLAMTFFAPMAWEAERFYAQPGLQKKNITLDWYPLGSGAFMLTVNNPNKQIVLERNPNFRPVYYPHEGEQGDAEKGLLNDAGQRLPLIDKAVFSLEKENVPLWNKFLQGYYDASGVSSDSFDHAFQSIDGEIGLSPEMTARDLQLRTAVSPTTYYFGFNMLDPVVGGYSERARLLRRAIAIAVDYEEFISIFLNGRGVVATSPIPPGIFGYEEGEAGMNPYTHDWVNGRAVRKPIREALALLEQAGYRDGRDLHSGEPLLLHYDTTGSGPDSKARLAWWRKQFDKLGIQLVIRNTDYNRFRDKVSNGTAQMFGFGWGADYPDPENFMFLLHGPQGRVQHQGENSVNYANLEFDALFERMKNLPNGVERKRLIERMIDILQKDAPWIAGLHPLSYALYHSWYGNAKPNKMANNTLMYKRIDAESRQHWQQQWNQPVWWPLLLLAVLLLISVIPAWRGYRQREQGTVKDRETP